MEARVGARTSVVDEKFAGLLAFLAKRARSRPRMATPPLSAPPSSWLRRFARVGIALGLIAGLSSCGNTLYAINANSASAKLEEARELGAELYAPYEFWFAQEHLDKAQTEASEGDYGDAVELAGISEEYADKAIQLARDAHRGAGR